MAKHAEAAPVLYYALEVEGREFLIVILSDGTSQWDDHTGRRRLRHPRDQYLELWAFGGDGDAFQRLRNECLEFTISVPISDAILAKAAEMAKRELKPGRYISQSTNRGIEEMDDLLTDFFWKAINPLLSQPIE